MFYQKSDQRRRVAVVTFPSPVSGTSVHRGDLAGQPMQVGIMHATFANQIGVQFTDFTLIASNVVYAATPSPATGLKVSGDVDGINMSWTPGAGSAGSLVVAWEGTNELVKEAPANGFTYTGDVNYGQGSGLPGAGYYVIYNGSGTNVTMKNLSVNCRSIMWRYSSLCRFGKHHDLQSLAAPTASVSTFRQDEVVLSVAVENPDVVVSFSANPGEWYSLQYSDTLNPANWQNAGAEPVLANSTGMVLVHINGALAAQRFYRLQQLDPQFGIKTAPGAIYEHQAQPGDVFPTGIPGGRQKRLGDVNLKYRLGGGNWLTARTSNQTGVQSVTYSTNAAGTEYKASYRITNGLSGAVILDSVFTFHQDIFEWGLNVSNLTSQSVEFGDMALPLPMNTAYSGDTSSALKHHYIEGSGSFIFWMRPDSVGPYLLMTPEGDTKLEYWDVLNGGFEPYIHSLTAAGIAATQKTNVITGGNRWRQPNTSLTLASPARLESPMASNFNGRTVMTRSGRTW